jgi:hypothetical protein
MNKADFIRTAVADYGDENPGVLVAKIRQPPDIDDFLSISSPDTSGIVVGTKAQADQLVEAIRAASRLLWEDKP